MIIYEVAQSISQKPGLRDQNCSTKKFQKIYIYMYTYNKFTVLLHFQLTMKQTQTQFYLL